MIHLKSTIILLLVLGLPKVYGTEIPLAIFILPLYLNIILFYCRDLKKEVVTFFILCVSWILWSIICFLVGDGDLKDLFFSFVILIKIILAVLFGFVVFDTIKKSINSLFYWLVIQSFFIILSIFSLEFYLLLLGFISPRSALVFSNIYGLRSLGFGLFHVEGAIIYVSVFAYIIYSRANSHTENLQFMLSFVIASTIARSAVIPFLIFSFFKKELRVWLLLLIGVLIIALPFIVDGVFYEALELIRSIVDDGDINIRSTQAVTHMYTLPNDAVTYIIGDGRFYDPNNLSKFYMSTDVGYMRLLYFGGVPLIFLFLSLNFLFCILPIIQRRILRSQNVGYICTLAALMALVLIIMNFKGIFTITMLSIVLFLQAKELTRNE